ncbi:MAG: NTPase [bacterium]
MVNNILLTVKTTVIQKVLAEVSTKVGGFYTREIRKGKTRTGFRIVSLNGEEGVLAHKHFKSRWRVGRYGVNVEDLDRVGVRALEKALGESDLIIMDEIGRMELFSERFRATVLRCLDSPKNVLGTIQIRRTPFLDAIRSRDDVTLMEVTAGNRNLLSETILEMFRDTGFFAREPQRPRDI